MDSRGNIVIVSPTLPVANPSHAGSRYLFDLAQVLPENNYIFIVPKTRENIHASREDAAPPHIMFDVPVHLNRIHQYFLRFTPFDTLALFRKGLLLNPAAVAALESAQIIDAQWESIASLLPELKRISPKARLLATLHDVESQRFTQKLSRAKSMKEHARLSLLRMQALWHEFMISRTADTIIVFSEKDRLLLPGRAKSVVVYPKAGTSQLGDSPRAIQKSGELNVLFIGPLYRAVNREALEWTCAEVWPLVRESIPNAQLIVAGMFDEQHINSLRDTPGIDLRGFVPDLADLNTQAGVLIAPLLSGAGVKFKVLDALCEGIPLVTTSIGAEGIGDGESTLVTVDNPEEFAQAIISALENPQAALATAGELQVWAQTRYGKEQFSRRISGIYGVGDCDSPSELPEKHAIATVVIPVFNNEHFLADQLEALARQDVASELEVIVSDNGSTDRSREIAQQYRDCFAHFLILDSGDKKGVSHARNMGIKAARSEKILFCDGDDIVRAGWASAFIAALENTDVTGGPAISSVISPGDRALNLANEFSALKGVGRYLPYAIGGNLAVRKSAAGVIGGFDETLFFTHEETDFCWRLQQAGFTIKGTPDAIIDYRQRNTAVAAGKQYFNSARSLIQLWTLHPEFAELKPLSLRTALLQMVATFRYLPHVLWGDHKFSAARKIGWSMGTVDGHFRFRFRK